MIDVGWSWAQVAQAALLVLYIEYEAVRELETRTWFPGEPPMAPDGLPAYCDYLDAMGFVRDLVFQEAWRFAGQHDWPVLRVMEETQEIIYAALAVHREAAAVAGAPPHWRPLRFAEDE